jgi:hypothetical protein
MSFSSDSFFFTFGSMSGNIYIAAQLDTQEKLTYNPEIDRSLINMQWGLKLYPQGDVTKGKKYVLAFVGKEHRIMVYIYMSCFITVILGCNI